jgi:hypothetical protein
MSSSSREARRRSRKPSRETTVERIVIMPATVRRWRKNLQPFSVLRSFEQAQVRYLLSCFQSSGLAILDFVDGSAIWQRGKRLLHRGKEAFHIGVEELRRRSSAWSRSRGPSASSAIRGDAKPRQGWCRLRRRKRGMSSTRSKNGHRCCSLNCASLTGSCGRSQCCEPTAEERGAVNPHATFCGNRRRATASGDPVGEE